jgi:acetolactate synthase-1/2/3 large subunit
VKASDLFVRCLEAEGIEYVFGVPGEENADFAMSLDASESIDFVLTRHEQGAAFMADVYGRLTGNPAVALGTLGPGATNLVTGVADANMDRAPMLVVTGQADSRRQHKESHQAMDVVSMFRPITKSARSVLRPDSIPEMVRKAVRLARTEKPGAVHIELAEDIAAMETPAQPMKPRRYRRPAPDGEAVNHAFELIRDARQPLILAGNGCIREDASAQLRRFCERTGIGVLSTFMAKGCVDMDADYCLFTIGLQSRDWVTHAVEEADLIVTLGYDMVEYEPLLWNPGRDKRIVHIDIEPAEIDDHYHPEVEAIGDIPHALEMLNERLDSYLAGGGVIEYELDGQRAVRRAMQEDFAEYAEDDTEGSIRPQKVLWDARHALAPRDVLLSDVGAHKMWIARYYQCNEPNTCLIPNGFCSMGFALPGAIAAHLVAPDRRVLAICGDGGFLMNVQEMETARRLDCDIVVMVWEDGGYGLIEWKQNNEFGRHTDLAFGNPDWLMLAESFGWNGYRCDRSAELASTLERAFESPGPSLVVVPIDYRENMLLTERLGNIECPV